MERPLREQLEMIIPDQPINQFLCRSSSYIVLHRWRSPPIQNEFVSKITDQLSGTNVKFDVSGEKVSLISGLIIVLFVKNIIGFSVNTRVLFMSHQHFFVYKRCDCGTIMVAIHSHASHTRHLQYTRCCYWLNVKLPCRPIYCNYMQAYLPTSLPITVTTNVRETTIKAMVVASQQKKKM